MSRLPPCDQCGKPSVITLYRCHLCQECHDKAQATSARWHQEDLEKREEVLT